MSSIWIKYSSKKDDPFYSEVPQRLHYYPSPNKSESNKFKEQSILKPLNYEEADPIIEHDDFLNASHTVHKMADGNSDKFDESWPTTDNPSVERKAHVSDVSQLTDHGFVPISAEMPSGYASDKYRSFPTTDVLPKAVHQPVPESVLNTVESPSDGSALSRYIERFRYSQPQSREQRQALGDSIRPGDVTKTSLLPESRNKPDTHEVPTKKQGPSSNVSSRLSADGRRATARKVKNVADQSFDEASMKLQQKADSLLTEVDRAMSSCSSEPAVSTVGLGSSSSRAPSIFEEEPVRPSFTKLADEADELLQRGIHPMRPEDDILYQWRVRHKIEVAKTQAAPVKASTVESKMADFKRLLLTESSSCTQCSTGRHVASERDVAQQQVEPEKLQRPLTSVGVQAAVEVSTQTTPNSKSPAGDESSRDSAGHDSDEPQKEETLELRRGGREIGYRDSNSGDRHERHVPPVSSAVATKVPPSHPSELDSEKKTKKPKPADRPTSSTSRPQTGQLATSERGSSKVDHFKDRQEVRQRGDSSSRLDKTLPTSRTKKPDRRNKSQVEGHHTSGVSMSPPPEVSQGHTKAKDDSRSRDKTSQSVISSRQQRRPHQSTSSPVRAVIGQVVEQQLFSVSSSADSMVSVSSISSVTSVSMMSPTSRLAPLPATSPPPPPLPATVQLPQRQQPLVSSDTCTDELSDDSDYPDDVILRDLRQRRADYLSRLAALGLLLADT